MKNLRQEAIREEIKGYLLSEGEDFIRSIVMDINSWDSSLEYLEYHINDEEFFKTYFGNDIMEGIRATQYGDYRYNDEYVKFNGYGNLDSCNYIMGEYEDNIEEIVDRLIDVSSHVYLEGELEELVDSLEEEEITFICIENFTTNGILFDKGKKYIGEQCEENSFYIYGEEGKAYIDMSDEMVNTFFIEEC